ncbi:MAG: hypothetical protein HY303_15265, partial [Candidatus Wallbacteria bacterium]|nr:hypothetical protein [Candidatus Wallbacteria bacterium]
YGVVRTTVRARSARVVHSLPPVLSKFALMVARSSELAANVDCLRYDSVEGLFRDAASGARTGPLVVLAASPGAPGNTPGRDAESGRLLPIAAGLPSAEKTALDAGWICLGGPDPWFLNLTLGSGRQSPLEEHHLLRRLEYVFPSPLLGTSFEQKSVLLGFAQGVTKLPWIGGSRSSFRSPSTDAVVPERTSFLHLAGDLSGVTPSIVFGPVFRRYLAFDKVRRGATGSFESFVNLADADAYQRQGGTFAALTGRGFEAYQQLMPHVVEEAYNRTYDYLVTSREESEAEQPARMRPGATPVRPARLLAAAGLLAPVLGNVAGTALSSVLYPAPPSSAQSQPCVLPAVRISRRMPTGSTIPIFQGQLGKLEEMEPLLQAKVTRLYPSADDLADRRSFEDCFIHPAAIGKALDLDGNVVRLPQGELRLGGLQVVGGGMLLATGDVIVDGPIECAPGEALSLVSLHGNIRIATSARVQACLVALRGQLFPPSASGMEILGTVACRDLANFTKWLENPGVKRIVYDSRLDPTRMETHRTFYRLVLAGEEARYLLRY